MKSVQLKREEGTVYEIWSARAMNNAIVIELEDDYESHGELPTSSMILNRMIS